MRWLVLALALFCGACGEPPLPTAAPPAVSGQRVVSSSTVRLAPVDPDRLRVADVDAAVVPLRLTGTALVPPPDPAVLGWWGRRVGAAHGVTLLVGHTVHTGGGALDDLEHVSVGVVARVAGLRYRVVEVRVLDKTEVAREAAVLFGQEGRHRLVVVTCEGYDPASGEYDSNVVLVAVPVRR